ncbi:helix-turn-helix domain-containing protein [Nocardioides dongxiaopingii]|uniref:helix-turn-helix domain-containing protein n=1 Tax=Nocardioides sp. S-1144 TaxID=2582905 RepID=UPI001C9E7595|nr:helix-turn-helix transcriptional regulator [Nocardioides sp. S-1144]
MQVPAAAQPACAGAPVSSALLDREREVLDLVVLGLANHEMAECLGISQAMIKKHLSRAYRKLGVRTRAHAVVTWGHPRHAAPDPSPGSSLHPALEAQPPRPHRGGVPDDGLTAGADESRPAGWVAPFQTPRPPAPSTRAARQTSPIPPSLTAAALAKAIGQDLEPRTWANPRDAQLTEAPWPVREDPMVLFLVYQAVAAVEAGASLTDSIRRLAVRAWFEGGVEGYDLGQRDARRPRST